ncbi:MAG TPA: hypothetical protein VGL91_18310 [Acidobacteriota bacterium]
MKRQIRHVIRYCAAGTALLCVVAVGLSALINYTLPIQSQVVDRLSALEKARVAEVFHLRQTLGDKVWPGWGQKDIPVIVYNEKYAFLIGYPNPPAGWIKMPQRAMRGGPWQTVQDDTFDGQLYYRQQLPDPNRTPESFTVLVGERWVASIQTREYAEISFYKEFGKQLPRLLKGIFPYAVVWNLLMGETDTYIGAVEHEAFHSFQGMLAPSRLKEAESINHIEAQYHWDDSTLNDAWQGEMNLLVQAVRAASVSTAAELAHHFLAERDKRRAASNLIPELIDYERQREWLEGLAKYAEVSVGRIAATTPSYRPVPALTVDPNFKHYATRERFWSQQLDEARRTMGRKGEVRFYYSGMAQAALLDRLLSGWKKRIFNQGVALEDLLREIVHRP